MKQFCFLNEDDLDNLPKDFKLIPFDVDFLDHRVSETPKISTSEKSKQELKSSIRAGLELSNPIENG